MSECGYYFLMGLWLGGGAVALIAVYVMDIKR